MKVDVLFFAVLREAAGTSCQNVDAPAGATAGDLARRVLDTLPSIPRSLPVSIAVNEEFVEPDYPLHDGDTVAVIPPVSGG